MIDKAERDRLAAIQLYERGVPTPRYKVEIAFDRHIWNRGRRVNGYSIKDQSLQPLVDRVSEMQLRDTDDPPRYYVSEDRGKTWREIEGKIPA